MRLFHGRNTGRYLSFGATLHRDFSGRWSLSLLLGRWWVMVDL